MIPQIHYACPVVEDTRSHRERQRDQWQSSKVKQLPKIPKRKAKAQYRGRGDTSPGHDVPANTDNTDTLTHPDEASSCTGSVAYIHTAAEASTKHTNFSYPLWQRNLPERRVQN